MIEMRWVRPAGTTTFPGRLQFRVHLPVVDAGGNLCPGDWTAWKDVSTYVEPEGEGNG